MQENTEPRHKGNVTMKKKSICISLFKFYGITEILKKTNTKQDEEI
jgi:hypothetical protein